MTRRAYSYFVHPIMDDNETSYKAIIPAFNNAVVYGANLAELEEGIDLTIKEEIAALKKAGKPIPKEDRDIKASGRILLRISPVIHEKLILEAKANKVSLNRLIERRLSF